MTDPSAARVVAHVVDRVTGGVPVAVRTYIENASPSYAHVIVSPFRDGAPAPVWAGLDVTHVPWNTSNAPRAIRDLRRTLRHPSIDVVHAHSSFPGVYARLVCSPRRTRVVYTPHCFAFVRADVTPLHRAGFRLVERLLSRRTSVLAACGEGERREAARVGFSLDRCVVVPNVASVRAGDAGRAPHRAPTTRLRIGMLGRWAAQKDPAYFVARADELRRALPSVRVEAVWIGDGTATTPDKPRVRVTGWLDREAVRANLADLDVYVHSAAWEGFPIAILDAASAGLPILARRIDALPDLPAALTTEEGIEELAQAVRGNDFPAWSARNRARWAQYLGPRGAVDQRRALAEAWR